MVRIDSRKLLDGGGLLYPLRAYCALYRSNSPRSTMSFLLLTLAVLVARALAVFDIDSCPNAVGVCYSVWHSLGYKGTPPPDITEIRNGTGNYAGQGQWHFWGRPDGGYYHGSNRSVLRRHFHQISEAGIDFIVIDATNLVVRVKSH